MNDMGDRLRKARIGAGYKYASEAAKALGVTSSTYRAHENGQNEFGVEEAEFYAKRFGVSAGWLLMAKEMALVNGNQRGTTQSPIMDLPNARIGDKVEGLGRKIPVYGQAVGGIDGEFLMNGSILYEVMAPPVLSHISGAYAVSISGDSMYPRYEDGEIAFVDPKRRVRKGDYVIAQIRLEEEGLIHAYVKKFIRHNAIELVLEQFNPAKELRFSSAHVVSVHYIALAGNA